MVAAHAVPREQRMSVEGRAAPAGQIDRTDPRADAEQLIRLAMEGRLGAQTAITCRGRGDGVGAQAIGAVSAMVLGRLAGLPYRHTPFTTMSHVIGDPKEWARSWERFFALGHGETPVAPDADTVSLAAMVSDPAAYADRPVVIQEPVYRLQRVRAWPIQEALRATLRARYRLNSKAAIPLHRGPPGSLTAAIHMRRGDVTPGHSWRYVADERILRSIERLRAAIGGIGRSVHVNLYSEGEPADFPAFAQAGCRLHISTDTQEAFHNMVLADILVRAPGNFSELAGLLSKGIVIAPSVHSAPSSNCLLRRANGDFSIKGLQRMLLSRAGWLERRGVGARRWWRRLVS